MVVHIASLVRIPIKWLTRALELLSDFSPLVIIVPLLEVKILLLGQYWMV